MNSLLRPIFYDFETTGVSPQEDEVIEIAAFDPVLNRTFEEFVKPTRPIPPEATSIHNITNEMVEKAKPFSEVGKAFLNFCQGEIVLIAHNNDAFDYLFLLQESKRHQLKLPSFPTIDSLKWARKYRPDLPKHSLQYLRVIYGVAENQAHRALNDVMVLHKVFSSMIDDLDYKTVLSLLASDNSLPSHMPFGKYRGKPLTTLPLDYIKWLKEQGALDKAENAPLKKAFEKANMLIAD